MSIQQVVRGVAPVVAVGIVGWYTWTMSHVPRRDVTEVCLSNVRQCCLALRMYAQDYDSRFPARPIWMDASRPYLKNDAVFVCPELKRAKPIGCGYAFHDSLLGQRLDGIQSLADEPMVFDSAILAHNACAGLESLPRPPRHSNHKYNVVGYMDGHAEGLSQDGERKPSAFFKGSPGFP